MNPELEFDESERRDDIVGLILSATRGLAFAPVAYYRAFSPDAFERTSYEEDVGVACRLVPWLAPAPDVNNLTVRVTDRVACIEWLAQTHGREFIMNILLKLEAGA